MAEADPYFRSLAPPKPKLHDEAAASREASREEMAYLRALGRPRVTQPELPFIKAPSLPDDFAQGMADLDQEIYSRGIAIDTDKLVELGKERFAELLALDRKARSSPAIGVGTDVTTFASVQRAVHAFETASVPKRKTMEVLTGSGKEQDAVRQIKGWPDLWKATEEPQLVQDVYGFHNLFASLVFGQSMLEKVSRDGRVRSHLFCGGRGRKVDLFREWLSVTKGSFTSVTLLQPLWHLLAWLANEKTSPPSPIDLARDFFGIRVPSLAQLAQVQAVLDGFLLGYHDWPLWEFVGRRTSAMPDNGRIETWRKALAARYPRITGFHAELRAVFYRDVGFGFESHREFEPARHRAFINRMVQEFVRNISALLALGTEETSGAVTARFQDWVLVEGDHNLADKRAVIGRQLAAAFPRSTFELEFAQVKP